MLWLTSASQCVKFYFPDYIKLITMSKIFVKLVFLNAVQFLSLYCKRKKLLIIFEFLKHMSFGLADIVQLSATLLDYMGLLFFFSEI